MSNSRQVRTIVLPLRKFCASLPAVALVCAGIAFSAPAAPAAFVAPARGVGVAISSGSSAIVVPDTEFTMPSRVTTRIWTDPFAVAAPETRAPMPPGETVSDSAAAVALDSTGVPVRVLEAYRAAATMVDAVDSACHIDWALLAAIGRVESNHARFGGNQTDTDGVAQPGIIGIPLDGTNGTARITDSDGGRLDRDNVYDRAVGPMQFIPSTWRVMGVDADGDGVKNPQDMEDAATATAIYLCSGPGDLSRPQDLHAAIMRYNASESYASTVIGLADAYRRGVSVIPAADLAEDNRRGVSVTSAADLAADKPAPSTSGVTSSATIPAARVPAAPNLAAPNLAAPNLAAAHAPAPPGEAIPGASAPEAPLSVGPASGALVPVPVPAQPSPAVPAEPGPAQPGADDPATPVPAAPVSCLPGPTPTLTPADPTATLTATDPTATLTATDPKPDGPCLPDPCLSGPPPTGPGLTAAPDPSPSVPTIPATCAIAPPDPTPTLIP